MTSATYSKSDLDNKIYNYISTSGAATIGRIANFLRNHPSSDFSGIFQSFHATGRNRDLDNSLRRLTKAKRIHFVRNAWRIGAKPAPLILGR